MVFLPKENVMFLVGGPPPIDLAWDEIMEYSSLPLSSLWHCWRDAGKAGGVSRPPPLSLRPPPRSKRFDVLSILW